MASTGFTLAGTGANNADAGTRAWANPDRITASDDSRSVVTGLNSGTGDTSQWLQATNFGFAIPSGATIDGIEVRFERQGGTENIQNLELLLIKGGVRGGTDHAVGASWATSDELADFGGVADLWGLTLTDADINAADFGVALRVQNVSSGSVAARIDAIWINVHYTEGGGGATIEASLTLASSLGMTTAAQVVLSASLSLGTAHAVTSVGQTALQASVTLNAALAVVQAAQADLLASVAFSASLAASFGTGNTIAAELSLAISQGMATTATLDIQAEVALPVGLGLTAAAQAQLEAAATLGYRAGLAVLSQAILQAGLTLQAVQTVTVSGSTIIADLETPEGRTIAVAVQVRTIPVPADDRESDVAARQDNTVDADDRSSTVPARTRTITVH